MGDLCWKSSWNPLTVRMTCPRQRPGWWDLSTGAHWSTNSLKMRAGTKQHTAQPAGHAEPPDERGLECHGALLRTVPELASPLPVPPCGQPEVLALGTQSCLTLCAPVSWSPPGSPVPGISQARMLELVAISFSRGPSQLKDWTWVSCTAGRLFTVWATREAPYGQLNSSQTVPHVPPSLKSLWWVLSSLKIKSKSPLPYSKFPTYEPSSHELSNRNFSSVRHEWNRGLSSVSCCRPPFSSAVSCLLSLLRSVILLAWSLDASPCMPAVVLHYWIFQGTIL